MSARTINRLPATALLSPLRFSSPRLSSPPWSPTKTLFGPSPRSVMFPPIAKKAAIKGSSSLAARTEPAKVSDRGVEGA